MRLTPGTADVTKICNEEKTVPADWITPDGSDVTEAFLNYARPLIPGTGGSAQKDGSAILSRSETANKCTT